MFVTRVGSSSPTYIKVTDGFDLAKELCSRLRLDRKRPIVHLRAGRTGNSFKNVWEDTREKLQRRIAVHFLAPCATGLSVWSRATLKMLSCSLSTNDRVISQPIGGYSNFYILN